ncbi:hypothetical protein MPTK1_2g06510 [Marchantia polymorpha subsp. ruderalis]|uniref:Uncharacterized protein n=1 Tax=Marchantia polymorpha TaxID=3197 RepID=A0A2R6XDW3_MARPO|nr:hypothetical protein MARPO_0021s0106 [Marchantia polymorpha]BBN01327.1 hypothetical protein Mp_2g06510 [Marchantia polymorpha subsp. ruderalis]|eukprot:PTQ44249.1 hypothetical protein MARPO_0021s0106 [Marchantia polymorpha]
MLRATGAFSHPHSPLPLPLPSRPRRSPSANGLPPPAQTLTDTHTHTHRAKQAPAGDRRKGGGGSDADTHSAQTDRQRRGEVSLFDPSGPSGLIYYHYLGPSSCAARVLKRSSPLAPLGSPDSWNEEKPRLVFFLSARALPSKVQAYSLVCLGLDAIASRLVLVRCAMREYSSSMAMSQICPCCLFAAVIFFVVCPFEDVHAKSSFESGARFEVGQRAFRFELTIVWGQR